MPGTDFHFMYILKSQELFWGRASVFTFTLVIFSEFGTSSGSGRKGRKKACFGSKKAANNFFDGDHHFEPHKIGFLNFDQKSDVPKRGL